MIIGACLCDFTHPQFSRLTSTKSQYGSYLEYTRTIGEKMGFVVREDSLRIPSSKRVSDAWSRQEGECYLVKGVCYFTGGSYCFLEKTQDGFYLL